MLYWQIRYATIEDKPAILRIAHQYRNELGYVHPVGLATHITNQTVLVAERHGELLGFVEWHHPQRGKNKGYHVVYHLAVDRHQRGQGIARNLLAAVPVPVRLRCTVDNAPANQFYESVNMALAAAEPGKNRALNVWERHMLFIQVAGDNRALAQVACSAGIAYGARDDDPPKDYPFMFDVNWKKYDWSKYLDKVDLYRPVQAMVPDYEVASDRQRILDQSEELKAHGVLRVMVCPKFDGAIADIPDWCIVAVSVPSGYSGFLPKDFGEFAGRKVHLLGGSVKQHIDLIQKINGAGGHVISTDGSQHTMSVKSNQVYCFGKWRQIQRHEKVDLYAQMTYSARNIAKHLNAATDAKQVQMV